MLPNAVVSDFREPVAHAYTPFWYLKLPTDGLDGESEAAWDGGVQCGGAVSARGEMHN